jgi:DNA-binding FadR family transcriptional regulator
MSENRSFLTARRIGMRIISGELPPESSVLEREQSRIFCISRAACREAFMILAAKGMLRAHRRSGTRVTSRQQWNLLDSDVLAWIGSLGSAATLRRHALDYRRLVEPYAAMMAATQRTPDTLRTMRGALDMMSRAANNLEFGAAAEGFHRSVFSAGGNPLMTARGEITKIRGPCSLQHPSQAGLARLLDLYNRLYEDFARADAEAATSTMKDLVELSLANPPKPQDRARHLRPAVPVPRTLPGE